jgi:hypothetical protein
MNLLRAMLLALLLCAMPAIAQTGNPTQNNSLVLQAATAQTSAFFVTADQANCCWQTGTIIINVTAWTSGVYIPTVDMKDPASGAYVTVLFGDPIAGPGIYIMDIGPMYLARANRSSRPLPQTWRMSFTGTLVPSMTFSIGVFLN